MSVGNDTSLDANGDESPSTRIRALAEAHGFALMGIAPAAPTAHADALRDWIDAGRHGEMGYLEANLEKRLDPRVLLAGAQSVICVADRHASEWKEGPRDGGNDPSTGENDEDVSSLGGSVPRSLGGSAFGRIARYAWGDDYHTVMKKRLHAMADAMRAAWPGHETKVCVDTAPILEREHAARAGLGWVGKHTLLIHPQYGSWFLLGEIVTTMGLVERVPGDASCDAGPLKRPPPGGVIESAVSHCGSCTRCIDACPTGCITPYQLDASRCISYLTIEHRSVIDVSLHESMGDWVAGCDVCQEVCPFNTGDRGRGTGDSPGEARFNLPGSAPKRPVSPPVHPRYVPPTDAPHAPDIPLLDILGWDAEARANALRGSALKRIKLDMFKRNALIAAGNWLMAHDDVVLRERIRALMHDDAEPELVRHTAAQVDARLSAADR